MVNRLKYIEIYSAQLDNETMMSYNVTVMIGFDKMELLTSLWSK
jgi:hypothetical protein